MFRRSTFATTLWLLAVALLPIRIANAHLHVCLDGQDAAVSYHVQDVPTHSGAVLQSDGHTDRDIEASGATATQNKLDDRDDGILLLPVMFALALPLPTEISDAPPASAPRLELTSAFDLRPPARGPPR